MAIETILTLSGSIGSFTLEQALLDQFSRSLHSQSVVIDLRDAMWVSPVALSLITCWAYEIGRRNKDVNIRLPTRSGPAAAFLNTIDAASEFTRLGWSVIPSPSSVRGLPPQALCAFQSFANEAQLQDYLDRISDNVQRAALLHAEDPPAVIRTGDFHSVVLKELLDNTFAHAAGTNSHYAVLRTDSAMRLETTRNPIFASFAGASYIEICVADSAERNLVETLKEHIPDNYTPSPRTADSSNFNRRNTIDKSILFAFEYSSTSNPERRRAKLAQWLNDPSPSTISTGLYDLAVLARAYRAQIVVRTAGRIASLDFSGKTRDPNIQVISQINRRPLVHLPGTLIAFRAPLLSEAPTRLTRSSHKSSQTSQSRANQVQVVAIALDVPTTTTDVQAHTHHSLAALEQQVCSSLQSRSTESYRISVLLLDGISPDAKLLGAFVQALLPIPRNGNALVVATHDTKALEAKTRALHGARSHLDIAERYPSFVVAPWPSSSAWTYGSAIHPDGTALEENDLLLPGRSLRFSLPDIVHQARTERLRQVLSTPPIHHTDALFLIESKYYTRSFYEVRRLLDSISVRTTLTLWLAFEIERSCPSIVLYSTAFLETLITDAINATQTKPSKTTPQILPVTKATIAERRFHATTGAGPSGRILFVTDVMCTAGIIREFISGLPRPERVSVVAIVDARPDAFSYLPIQTSLGSTDVPVFAVYRKSVEPIYERPTTTALRDVIIVDPKTNSPTQYTRPAEILPDDESIFARAAQCGALSAGHFTLSTNHYLYFLEFLPLFRELRREIVDWLQIIAHTILAIPKSSETITLCLDEQTDLFGIVENVARATGLPGPKRLTRDSLAAPPAQGTLGSNPIIWFILPAMATGITVHRCLEYGTRLNALHISISIVASRVSPETLIFYKNITRYRQATVDCRELLSVPLMTYGRSECPECARMSALEITRSHLLPRAPHMSKMLMDSIDQVIPLSAKSAGSLARGQRPANEDAIWKEAYFHALYHRAIGDVEARQRLKLHLLSMDGAIVFAGMVGREASLSMFAKEVRDRVLYGSDPFPDACRDWAAQEPIDVQAFARQFRGFAALAPDVIRGMISNLFTRHAANSLLLRTLLVEASVDHNILWAALDSGFEPEDAELRSSFNELIDYARRGARSDQAIRALGELRWHLSRSTGWGLSLQALGLALRHNPPSLEETEAALRQFLHDGMREAERLLACAQRTGGIWERLSMLPKSPTPRWNAVRTAVAHLQSLLVGNENLVIDAATTSSMEAAIMSVEDAGNDLVEVLDQIAIRPELVIEQARAAYPAVQVEVAVSDDCPAIAMIDQDFQQIVLALLENANDLANHLGAGKSTTRFEFSGTENLSGAVLCVRDEHAWTRATGLDGGLARIRELCAVYGALVQAPRLRPSASDTDLNCFQIRFRAWVYGG